MGKAGSERCWFKRIPNCLLPDRWYIADVVPFDDGNAKYPASSIEVSPRRDVAGKDLAATSQAAVS